MSDEELPVGGSFLQPTNSNSTPNIPRFRNLANTILPFVLHPRSRSDVAIMGSEPQYAQWPLLPLSQHVFTLTNPYASRAAQDAAVKKLQDTIEEHKMASLYRYLAHPLEGILNAAGEGGATGPGKPLSRKSSAVGMIATRGSTATVTIPWDEALYQKLKESNDKELEEIQKEEDEAVEKAGDTEIQAARGKRAEFWARVGDKVRWHSFPACYALEMQDLTCLCVYRRSPLPPTKTFLRRRVSSAPRSTSSSP